MKIDKELLKGSTAIMLLGLLDEQARYGYELIKELEARSNGVFAYKEGTLYPILHQLEAQGLLTSFWSEGEGARKRKYYELTQEGRQQLAKKKKEWATFRTAVDFVLGVGRI